MDMFRKLIILNVSILVIVFSLILYFELFTPWTFVSVLYYGILFMITYSYVTYSGYLDSLTKEEITDAKQKFDYCFAKISQWSLNQPGGESLTWDAGKGCQHDTKSIPNREGKDTWYMAFIAYTSESQIRSYYVYDIDKENVVKYLPQPTPDIEEDIWSGFKPYDQGQSAYNPFGMENQYVRTDRRSFPRRNHNIQQPPEDEYEAYIQRAKSGANNNEQY